MVTHGMEIWLEASNVRSVLPRYTGGEVDGRRLDGIAKEGKAE